MLPSYPEATRRKLARNVLEHTLRLKRGENLLIETWSGTLPWAESFVLESRILGARPMLAVEDEPTYWKSLDLAPEANVGHIGSHEWAALKASNAHVYLLGPGDTLREERRPPRVVQRTMAGDHEWFRLVHKYGIRCARWDLGRTNETWARRYGIDLGRWRRELIEGASVDPRTLRKDGLRIAEVLAKGREVSVSHPNGTDLKLRLKGRRPKIDDGVIDEADLKAGNLVTVVPSGVTAVALDEERAEGRLESNATGVMFSEGRETALGAASWRFERDRLSGYRFESGGAAFAKAFRKLGPGNGRPGLISVGLNPQITDIPLLTDQQLGVISFTVGANHWLGGATRTPHFSAYTILHGGTLEVDGRPIVKNGRLVPP